MSKVDVMALGQKADMFVSGTDIVDCHIGDLERFASLVLEEAAKVCDRRNVGDCNREDQEAVRCASAIRALKPVQS